MAMRRLIQSLVTVALVAGFLAPDTSFARTDNVERWVASELAPYATKQLSELPRFRDVTVQIVVFNGGAPASRTDGLSAMLRDELQRRVARTDGVRIAWRSASGGAATDLPRTGADCEALRADVLLGLETESLNNGRWRVSLRALDTVERSWIPQVSMEWRGELTRRQRSALRQSVVDNSLRGDRDLPYGAGEPDLIAAHLAQELRCELMRQTWGEYRIEATGSDADDPVLNLVRHQISGTGQLDVVGGSGHGNAELTSTSHSVDAGLSQYWVRLTPTDPDGDLRSIGASVYVHASQAPPIVAVTPTRNVPAGSITALRPGATDILSSVALVDGSRVGGCGYRSNGTYGRRSGGKACGALSLNTDVDAFVFVVNYQLQRGLVRVGAGSCMSHPAPELVRAGETTIVTLPESDVATDWMALDRWSSAPGTDAYYAIAVSNGRAARDIAAHVNALPARCSESVRAGLRGDALVAWLRTLESQLSRWGSATDWRAIELQQLY